MEIFKTGFNRISETLVATLRRLHFSVTELEQRKLKSFG